MRRSANLAGGPTMASDPRQIIQEMAYSKWEQAGWPSGDGVNFWLEAEQEFFGQQDAAESAPRKSSAARGSIKASLVAADPPPLKVTKTASTSRKRAS